MLRSDDSREIDTRQAAADPAGHDARPALAKVAKVDAPRPAGPGPGRPPPGKRPGAGAGPGRPAPRAGPVPSIAPPLSPDAPGRGTRAAARHFVLLVLLPLAVLSLYLWGVARDQFASVAAFSVRREEPAAALGAFAGLVGLGQGSSTDTDVLYDFLLSQDLAERMDRRFDLRASYARAGADGWPDPVFTLAPDAAIEMRHALWLRMLTVDYDQGEGVIAISVRAYDPARAQQMARAVVGEATAMINALSEAARRDALSVAEAELARAEDRLKQARQALTAFRASHQMVDPEVDLASQMGVIGALNEELAGLQVELDMLRRTTRPGDPRISARESKRGVIESRIAAERAKLGIDAGTGSAGYPALVADYEGLRVDQEFAEQSWLSARTALDAARLQAGRQSRYLATHVPPSRADTAQYPRRWRTFGLAAFLLALGWGVVSLARWSLGEAGA
ncbi:sugar transporter [Frigidibacter sp. MR17.14]|uniref:sugar transporter n=1 Tax=Frigidibacter sp. MR17.14 TaxID=3126509 RepID=UPI0030130B75